MPTIRGVLASALIAVAVVGLSGCGDSDESTSPDSAPSTTAAATTIAPSTAAPSTTAPPTTAAPTTAPPTTAASTTAAPTTASDQPAADGSGCTPGEGDLPDGRWYGLVTATRADGIDFDLACWFSGDAAIQAAADDGEESPPPNDYYVRNENPATRPLSVDGAVAVVWFPDLGDPTSEATTTFSDWVTQDRGPVGIPGVWVEIEGGSVVDIHEQWVP